MDGLRSEGIGEFCRVALASPFIPPSGPDHRELPLVHFQAQGVLMQHLSYLASFAFGALMGALLMAMIVSDDNARMAEAILGMSTIMRDDVIMLPVSKPERKR